MGKLTLTRQQENSTLTISIGGRIDTGTAPELENEVKSSISGITKLILGFENVEYISSSGLRVLLALHKAMLSNDGELIISKPTEIVREVFDVTGFADMLNVEY